VPEFVLSWTHDFGLDDREIVAAFEGDPAMTFTLGGQEVAGMVRRWAPGSAT
jgi:hypothetical protein